ncbi:MAG TPA: ATP-binding protein [Thermoanaerobaculia bacterium]|nr:ATP-binding protein [Thermoanaerobaculia bacterium]
MDEIPHAETVREEKEKRPPAEMLPRLVRPGEEAPQSQAQAQSMDAMGRLAGGIAHVFNNLLTAISCEVELALVKLPSDDAARKHLREIERAGERGAALARQLLAFSGRQVLHPKVLQLNNVLADLEDELRRVVGNVIELRLQLDPDLDRVNIDPAQLRQAILNIASNARDVMPDGGKLILETSNLEVRPGSLTHPLRNAPGQYVLLEVSDTGPGMSDEVRRRVFEPFFTTKQGMEVSGLGLSTAYGIITQSGGHMVADSETGKGSRFLIFLPSAEEERKAGEPVGAGKVWETILLVEDEENVRKPLRQILEARGYQVLEAADASQAMDISQSHHGPIHLMVTDILMSGMNGVELAERLSFKRPEMKVLFATGYPAGLAERPSLTNEEAPLIKKPFTGRDLSAKIREVLESGD